jgi:exonuclease SbcC
MRGAFEASVRSLAIEREAIARADEAEAERNAAEGKKTAAARDVEVKRKDLDANAETAARLLPEIERAKRLDVQLEEALRRADEDAREARTRDDAHRRASAEREAIISAIEAVEAKQRANMDWLLRHRSIEPLAAQWPRWKEALDRYRALFEASEARKKAEAKGARAFADAETAEKTAAAAVEESGRAVVARLDRATEIRRSLEAHRKSQPQELAREAVERITRELGALESMRVLVKETRRLQKELVEQSEIERREAKTAAQKIGEAAALAHEIGRVEEKLARLEAERARVEIETALAEKRHQLLHEGEPCPLCGSREHPFREAPGRSVERTSFAGAIEDAQKDRARWKAAHAAASEAASAHAGAERRAKEGIEKLQPEIARKDEEWKKKLEALEVIWLDSPVLARKSMVRATRSIAASPSAKNADASLQKAIDVFAAERDALKAHLREDEALAKAFEDAREAADRAEQDRRDAVKLVDRVRARVEEERRRLDKIAAAGVRDEALFEEAERVLAQAFDASATRWRASIAEDPAAFIDACARDVAAYEAALSARLDAAESMKKLAEERSKTEAEARLRFEHLVLAKREEDMSRTRAEARTNERRALLEGRTVEEASNAMNDAVESSERAWKAAVDTERRERETLAAAEARANEAVHSREQAKAAQKEADRRLEEALAAKSFGGDRRLLARLLAHDAEWIRRAEDEIARAKDAITRLLSAIEDRERQLAATAGDQPAIDRSTALLQMEAARTERIDAESKLVLAIEAEARAKNQLSIDDAQKKEIAHLRPEIERHKTRAERWAEMSSLIGSADGRKLRTFAQGLTLDVLLAQANLHLEQLRPRYRLERVPGFDMELQVVDGDMGDEVRAVATLSGGETFLVSLALALGLSSLSAKNVSIRSLFIDEGFGSLDKEALESALATLDQLQAEGRTIGLISHMTDVAERIGYQIHVRPTGPGKSEVVVLA